MDYIRIYHPLLLKHLDKKSTIKYLNGINFRLNECLSQAYHHHCWQSIIALYLANRELTNFKNTINDLKSKINKIKAVDHPDIRIIDYRDRYGIEGISYPFKIKYPWSYLNIRYASHITNIDNLLAHIDLITHDDGMQKKMSEGLIRTSKSIAKKFIMLTDKLHQILNINRQPEAKLADLKTIHQFYKVDQKKALKMILMILKSRDIYIPEYFQLPKDHEQKTAEKIMLVNEKLEEIAG